MILDIVSAIAELGRAFAWPAVVLVALLVFRKELGGLLPRIRTGPLGLGIDPAHAQPQAEPPPANPATAITAVRPAYPSAEALVPILREWVQGQGGATDGQRVEFLVSALASLGLIWRFEGIESRIWGSQVTLVEHLNALDAGDTRANLKARFYDPTIGKLLANVQPFDNYLDYVKGSGLIELAGDTAKITQMGRDYLAWRVMARKAPKLW